MGRRRRLNPKELLKRLEEAGNDVERTHNYNFFMRDIYGVLEDLLKELANRDNDADFKKIRRI